MRPRKKELEALSALLEGGAETPEQLAELFIKEWERLLAERSHVYACMIVGGFPLSVGPFSTKNQAQKAIEKLGADKAWIVTGWTPEGWERHLSEVDAKPEPHKPNAAEEKKREKAFWSTVRRIEDGDQTAIVCKNRGEVEIKAVKLPRGTWG
jgi:hypothetical protein